MQINNVQSSPNFGMALKIKSSAVDALKTFSRGEIEKLDRKSTRLNSSH